MHQLLQHFLAGHTRDLTLGSRLSDAPLALLMAASQIFWFATGWRWLGRRLRWPLRLAITAAVGAWFGAGLVITFQLWPNPHAPVSLTAAQALLAAPFQWWLFASASSFALLALYWVGGQVMQRVRRRPQAVAASADGRTEAVAAAPQAAAPELPSRRRFLLQAVAAAPFAVGAYGVLRGRTEIETTHPRIVLARLPAAMHGFRIAQLSDIHIGPFMTEREVRDVAGRVNALRPDLIVLTGDFVTWDGTTQYAAVRALAGLRAPFGIYGCLGNHEMYTGTERSITRLFRQSGTTILRQAAATIQVPGVGGGPGAAMQMLGVDFIPQRHRTEAEWVAASVPGVEALVTPGMVNILLAHTPNCFYRSSQLGIDLTISGHTHGGQICCLTPELSPGRLVSPFVAGHFRRGGSQLYVNRGLGTIALPIRIFAPPEITVYELQSGA